MVRLEPKTGQPHVFANFCFLFFFAKSLSEAFRGGTWPIWGLQMGHLGIFHVGMCHLGISNVGMCHMGIF